MTIKKTIPKPINWQDFETLCKKLFGEVWNCSDMKKNGRSGQNQHGVDISGNPTGKVGYYGIQCKGKDDYTDSSLTTKEIDVEIEKAKLFQPTLELFAFATTANKDAAIEEYVRKKDIESRSHGGFKIVLYCWEDLADLIEESKQTHNWWIKEKRYKQYFSVQVSFENEKEEMTIYPRFNKKVVEYKKRKAHEIAYIDKFASLALFGQTNSAFLENISRFSQFSQKTRSLSCCKIPILIRNTGQEVIEDYKFAFWTEGQFFEISDGFNCLLEPSAHISRPLYVSENGDFSYQQKSGRPLTQDDERSFNVYITPKPECKEIVFSWKLFARDYSEEGVLKAKVEPNISTSKHTVWVGAEVEQRTETEYEEIYEKEEPRS